MARPKGMHVNARNVRLGEALAEWLVCGHGEPVDLVWMRFKSIPKPADFSSHP